eukprot:TRINITY_DN3118_c2_g1_i1.p2 TRINITY_DN3118_c2_g1~~TRINITY_DN3118_c2_g1_i1.p2  ORF type:complete len:528 (+),score=120.20 TRINITY_DN3118_c2_g1_i1:106-1584(+)
MARGSVWIKILNCAVQLGPYGFQYVSMWMLIDLLVEYACEDSGWFFAFDDDPTCSANQCVGPSVRENIPRGTFECSRMGVPPVGIALLFVAVLLPLIVYQVWAVFRQVRHSTFGTLDYMCYLEVAKEKGSWFYHGLKVQVGLIILISLTVLIVAIIVLADKKANWKMYIKLLVKVGIRAAVGLFKIPHMLAYDGPVNGKAHARLCRYAMPGYSIKYSWMQDSQSLMTKITCILSIDPIVAEKILIESTHMQQGNKQTGIQALLPGRAPEEGTPEDRERDMETLLDDGVKVSQLKRATIGEGRGNLLGGGMGHVDASLMASIGQANDLWPEQVGKCGEDTREMVPWAETYRGPRRNSCRPSAGTAARLCLSTPTRGPEPPRCVSGSWNGSSGTLTPARVWKAASSNTRAPPPPQPPLETRMSRPPPQPSCCVMSRRRRSSSSRRLGHIALLRHTPVLGRLPPPLPPLRARPAEAPRSSRAGLCPRVVRRCAPP